MLTKISQELKEKIRQFSTADQIIFNNKLIAIDNNNFQAIDNNNNNNNNNFQNIPSKTNSLQVTAKVLAFIDGGQAEIISAGNFCLSFIRVFAQLFQENKKIDSCKNEFYLLTVARCLDNEIYYESKIYPLAEKTISGKTIFGKTIAEKMIFEKIIPEEELLISSRDQTIKTGSERAPISKISQMARRLAELSLAAKISAPHFFSSKNNFGSNIFGSDIKVDFIILDGTLEPTFKNEEKYLAQLPANTAALAKSSSLFTIFGNSPAVLLSKIGPRGCWSYFVENKTYFVKLHPLSKHVFRFEGDKEVLPELLNHSNDALFLGYPYSLIVADQLARVSNTEKQALRMNFLLRAENQEILEYLNTTNAHDILDSLG